LLALIIFLAHSNYKMIHASFDDFFFKKE